MTEKRLLVWHNDTLLEPFGSPVAVHAWIEYGSQLPATLIQPKLCWKEIVKNTNKETVITTNDYNNYNKVTTVLPSSSSISSSSSTPREILNNPTTFTFHGIDLLDISKIISMDDILDRTRYPLVQRNCCFLVEAFGGCQQMVFEARSEMERDDIMEGLKLIVSRLGSKIMVGDSTVLREFFSPLGSVVVPGGIPEILTTTGTGAGDC